MLKITDFQTVFPIWRDYLWPTRTSEITSTSAMVYLGGYNIDNINKTAVFVSYIINDRIVGVNSGHICADNSFRSRGLYVFEEYRKRGIAQQLLCGIIDIAYDNNSEFVWSFPKYESWNTYKNVGFDLSSDWEKSELGLNAYCIKKLKE